MTPEEMLHLRDQARAQGAVAQDSSDTTQVKFAHRQNAWDTGSVFPQSLPEDSTTPSTPSNSSSTPAVRLPSGSLLPSDPEVKQVLTDTANRYNINPALLLAVAQQESSYDPNAVGPQTRWGHASGMFQFLQDTARSLKIDPLNWRQAADATARSLAEQIAKGGTDWAIATHFAGTNPAEHGPKTRRYVAEVSAKAAVIANELGIDYTPTNTTPELLRRLQSGQRPSDTGSRTPQARQVPRASATPQSGESPSNWHAPMLYRPGQAAQQTPTTRQSQPPRQLPRQVAPDNMSPAQMLALRNGRSPQATSPTDTQGNRESLWETLSRNVSEAINPDDGDDGDDSWPFATPIVNAIERGWHGVQGLINRQTNQVTLSDADLQRRFEDQQSSMFSLKPRFRVGDTPIYINGQSPTPSSLNLSAPMMNWDQFRASPFYKSWEAQNRTIEMSTDSQADQRQQWLDRVRKDPTAISMLPARFSDVRDQVLAERTQAHGFAPSGTVTGSLQRFIEGFPNPLDALLGRSMPVNAVNYLANIPELERKRFEEGREITNALNAVNHPDQYSAEDLQHYTGMLQDWRQKTNPNVVHAWQNFYQAAQADPGNTALGFATSIMADPYLLKIPAGLGLTPIRGVRNLAGITTPMTRGLAGADAIIDGTISTAAVNTAIGITSDLATTGQVNTENAQLSAALGALLGAGGGGLAFLHGARAHLANIDEARASGKLDELLQAKATGEVAVENAIETLRTPEKDPRFAGERRPTITPMQRRIAELTGIPLHDAEVPGLGTAAGDVYGPQVKSGRKIPTEGVEHFETTGAGRRDEMISQWIKNRRAQVKEAFTNEADYHQYQQYVAAERLRLAQEAAARAQQQEAAQAQARQADLERTNRFQQEFEAATRQRDEQLARGEVENAHGIALAEQARRDSAEQLNASELFDAYTSQDQAAIRQAKANIDRRNGRGRFNQLGEISGEMRTILGRAAIATTLGAAGYAMSPDEHRLAGGILGGLAGLVVPLGGGSRGSILSYFHNIGAIDADGLPRGIRTFGGKIADAAEDARLKARDDAWVKAAAAGDHRAFENLYRAYSDTTRRYIDRMLRSGNTRVATDADGVMNEAFFKVYQWMQENPEIPIDNFRDFVGQSARNILFNTLKAERTIKRDMPTVSEADANAELDVQGKARAVGSSIVDQTTGVEPVSGKLIIDNVGETPEGVAMRDQLKDVIRKAVETQSDINQKVFTMRNFDNMSPQEVADALGISKNNVQVIDNRVKTRVQNAIVEKIPEVRELLEDRYAPGHEPKPKVRGPAGQRGSATTGDMATVATLAAAVGAASYFMSDENTWGALVSGGIAAALAAVARGKSGRFSGATRAAVALRAVDWRLREFGEHFYGMAKEHGMLESQAIAHYNNVTAPFSKWLNSLKPQVRAIMVEALSTRDEGIINGMLEHLGGQTAVEAFKPVRNILNNIEDTLVSLGIIKKSEVDYFPFRVKDLEGLRNALGIEQKDFITAALKAADDKMFKNLNRHLTQIEQDVIVNKLLEPYLGSRIGPQMPGFARARTIKTIPESLQRYYHDPVTTLNSYGQQAIKYIQRAKFFGKHLKMVDQEGKKVVDISASVGELTRSLHEAGKLTEQQTFELASMLQDRFNGGEQGSKTYVREIKNWSTASMLGQFVFSAVAQVNDLVWQIYRHGPRASIETAIRLAINKPLVRLKDFGITEHMVHEYISEGLSSKVVKKSLLVSGMSLMDNAAKSFGLNAALIEYRNMVKSGVDGKPNVKGEARLREHFGGYFPDKIEKIISDLREGKITPDTELLAWTDLTDTQPLTAWELPQLYHHLPNGRIIYHLQTFNIRAGNLIYEEAIKNITSGNVKQVMKGLRALTGFAVVFGAGGVAGDKIKDLLRGREIKLNPWEIPLNLVQAAGGNFYNYRTHRANTPMEAVINRLPPVIGMAESAYQDPTTLIRRVPAVGEWVYNLNRPRLQAWNKDRVSKFDHSITVNVEGREGSSSSSSSSGSSRNSRNSRRSNRRHY